ncbi:HAD family hydrolase [Streptomyces spongiae]|uniref:HAD family hydrolase n=1 Tax=Streptomyces spongiae TaxID=565072 RepID=A0A5N8XM44_9ACTN|nr:HAD-IA family hydrolase [Streptomyces spongiae]MPY60108.1 HAD family hydrolase [Streptomyces spongiae]
MTVETENLRELITPVRFVLWDLDGPICRLFAGHPAHRVAKDLVRLVEGRGLGGLLTSEERATQDPHRVLRGVYLRRPESDLIIELEEWLTRQELIAVPTAYPTAHADPLIRMWASRARFAITTNNAAVAAARYIESRGLTDCFPYIYGRTRQIDLMKPDPHYLLQALNAMGADPSASLMIGDAPSDFEAAQKARVSFLGYARNDDKLRTFLDAGVRREHIVSSMQQVRLALGAPA